MADVLSACRVLRHGGDAAGGEEGHQEEVPGGEGVGGPVSVGGDVPLPAGLLGGAVLAVGQTLQLQLSEAEMLPRTGEEAFQVDMKNFLER